MIERDDDGFVVEQPVDAVSGKGGDLIRGAGMARVWVGSEQRAQEIVREGAEATPPVTRTFRRVPLDQMPEHARENLLRAREAAKLAVAVTQVAE